MRSKKLAAGTGGAANVTTALYTVPADRTTILRSIHLSWKTSGTRVTISVRSGASSITVSLIDHVGALDEVLYLPTWLVMAPGDAVRTLSPTANAVHYWLSGAELVGVA